MRFRFRDKLLLAFAVLLLVTMVPVLLLVNAQIETISEQKIAEDLRNTGRVFQRFQEGQLATYSERTNSFILTQPEVRAEIATAGTLEAGFGEAFRSSNAPAAPAAPPSTARVKRGRAPKVGSTGGTGGGDPFGATTAAPEQVVRGKAGSGDPFGATTAAPEQVVRGAAPTAGGGDPFGATAAASGQVFLGSAPSADAPAAATPPTVQHAPAAAARTASPAPAAPARGTGQPDEPLPERQNLILSIVEEVALFRDSAVFFLTDFRGTVVFNKTDPHRFGESLAELPAVRAALAGNEIFTWWGTLAAELRGRGLLPGGDGTPRLYQMFLRPVVFAGEVKGLIGIGFPFGEAELQQVTRITQSQIAFVADAHVYVNSLHAVADTRLLEIDAPSAELSREPTAAQPPGTPASTEPEGGARSVARFVDSAEEYLALSLPVTSTLGEPVGTVLVYRSKTQEERVFVALRRVLNGIGVAALVVAAVLALGISQSVSRVVRQLFHGVSAVREGDLDVRLDIRSRDEFGELGRAFNEMTAGLKEKEQIRSTFKRYVSSSVVDELLRSGDSVKLGGESKQLTIQFSDIAGFTALSESLNPEQVVEFLNAYLSRMTEAVEAEQGIVDKYIGDAVMAFWGAPLPLPDHADRACLAALAQLRRVAELRSSWAQRGDLSRFDIRLGLHSGEVVVGNIGSDTRMDYTIIGDSVNLASRLEGMNKVYGTHILTSEDTVRLLHGRYALRELDRILVVGKSRSVRIYELAGALGELSPETMALHAAFAEALATYRERRFAEAERAFATLADAHGDKPARAFQRRCAEYVAAPPPEDWDGVYVSQSK